MLSMSRRSLGSRSGMLLAAMLAAGLLAAACGSSSRATAARTATGPPATSATSATSAPSAPADSSGWTSTTGATASAGTVKASPSVTSGKVAVGDPLPAVVAGAERLSFKFGPITVQPGQNNIQLTGSDVPKPNVDGWIVRMAPNLRRPDGSVPAVDVVHLHHAVWLNDANPPGTSPEFMAVGEEKTVTTLPAGYGYRYHASDAWTMTYMVHNLFPTPDRVYITYDLDFIPDTSPAAAGIKSAYPIWMDVQDGHVYPVFNAPKGAGHNGLFTYPDDDPNAYPSGPPLNQWTADRDMVLIGTAGHLHPGGLYDDLKLTRAGASTPPGSPAAASVSGGTAELFRSVANYFEPAGAVSWDVAMTTTPEAWRVAVHPGDVLSVHATYDTSKASWYEVMGIMVVWATDGTDGANPFQQNVNLPGVLNHGHLPENNNHGGQPGVLGDPTTFAVGPAATSLSISDFTYELGDFSEGPAPVPTVKQGQTLTFTNLDAPKGPGIWHTITACEAPCNASTGIAYPLANADIQFDSGELGTAGPPTAGTVTWATPATLPTGLYTYFCRIHPFMRGAFRVLPSN
jgi:plastocyanin